jgi:hypothetical protein
MLRSPLLTIFAALTLALAFHACDSASEPSGGVGQACDSDGTCDDAKAVCDEAQDLCACAAGYAGETCGDCAPDFTVEGEACVDRKLVPCVEAPPPHAHTMQVDDVEISFSDADGWSEPAICPWACDAGQYHAQQKLCLIVLADEGLRACAREALELEEGAPIVPPDAAALERLRCTDAGVADLTGMEAFTGLVELSLWENALVELGPLAGLTRLVTLQLGANEITDLTPLQGLTALEVLGLGQNAISDPAPLAGLQALRWLNLDGNQLGAEGIEAVTGLQRLTWLNIEHNRLSDVSFLGPLYDRGCEMYYDYQEDEGDRAASMAHPALGAPMGFAAEEGGTPDDGLLPRVDAEGRVRLAYRHGGRVYPVIPEFAGRLWIDDDRVLLSRGDASVEVGALTGDGPVLCEGAHAEVCQLNVGRKLPAAGARPALGVEAAPVFSAALRLLAPAGRDEDEEPGYLLRQDDLLPYVLASPNQLDGGTCLFMSNTGAMEILLNQHTPQDLVTYSGDTDLSERYLMNASGYMSGKDIRYTLTDTLYTYNGFGGSLLSRDYPFTMGYMKDNPDGSSSLAQPGDPDAYISCYVNWYDQLPDSWQDTLTPTPETERTLIYVDPERSESSQWNVGIVGPTVVERIKTELRTKNAPVIVVYNHFLYWHAAIIVGYDDTIKTDGCPFVDATLEYFAEQGADGYVQKVEAHKEAVGGCTNTGVFLVRDSIYDGEEDEPTYTYSESGPAYSQKYSKRLIGHSYDWVTFLGNHVYTVHRR